MDNAAPIQPAAEIRRPFPEVDPADIPAIPAVSDDGTRAVCDAPVDISEDELEYLITAELPGVSIDDTVVRLQGSVIEIRAKAGLTAHEKGRRYLRVERELGAVQRLFELPADADGDRLRYEQLDGVLRIFIPKIDPTPVSASALPEVALGNEVPLPRPPRVGDGTTAAMRRETVPKMA